MEQGGLLVATCLAAHALRSPDRHGLSSSSAKSLQQPMRGTVAANWIDGFLVSGEEIGLAAAPTKIDFLAGAFQTGARHPRIAAEALKRA